jgi:octaprenyl-diphosphate synthase
LLTILSSKICGKDDEDLLLLAAAFEYLHIASLTHDDIIDNASRRRGKESLIAKYGLAMAILAGDWLLSRSMRIIGTLTGNRGLEIFCQAAEKMVDGEFLQHRCIKSTQTTEEQYFDIVRCKTGNLIASACHIGAIYANADDSACSSLSTFGHHIGVAFQIIDDILDYQGDPEKTGKSVGNDFVEGKITLPLIHTINLANQEDKSVLQKLMEGDREDQKNYKMLHNLIVQYDGFSSSASMANQLIANAKDSLHFFQSQTAGQDSYEMLNMLADYIETRNK